MEIGCGDGALLAELGARGARAGARRLRALAARGRARARRGRSRARGGSRPTTASTSRRPTAPTTSRCSRTCSSTSRTRRRCCARPRASRPRCSSRSRSRPTAPPRRPAKRAEAARIGHIQFLDRAAMHALVGGAGLSVAAELSDPLPYAHHAFFATSRPRAGAGGAEGRRAARARGASRRGRPSGSSPSTTPASRGGASVARVTVREIGPGETALAARTLLELRPGLGSAAALVRQVDERQRPTGYRLVGAFADGDEEAAAVAGFRINEFLAWEKHLYVDDLVTAAAHRGQGHADRLFAWLEEEARQCRLHAVPPRLRARRGAAGRAPLLLPPRVADRGVPLPARAVGNGNCAGEVRGGGVRRGCAELDCIIQLNSARPPPRPAPSLLA